MPLINAVIKDAEASGGDRKKDKFFLNESAAANTELERRK